MLTHSVTSSAAQSSSSTSLSICLLSLSLSKHSTKHQAHHHHHHLAKSLKIKELRDHGVRDFLRGDIGHSLATRWSLPSLWMWCKSPIIITLQDYFLLENSLFFFYFFGVKKALARQRFMTIKIRLENFTKFL